MIVFKSYEEGDVYESIKGHKYHLIGSDPIPPPKKNRITIKCDRSDQRNNQTSHEFHLTVTYERIVSSL